MRREVLIETAAEETHSEHVHSNTNLAMAKSNGLHQDLGDGHDSMPRDVKEEPTPHLKQESPSHSPDEMSSQREVVVGGDVTLKQEPGQAPKLGRTSSHKMTVGPPRTFQDEPDKTDEAQRTFQMLSECSYSSKSIGSSTHDYMECDCSEEWGKIREQHDSICLLGCTDNIQTALPESTPLVVTTMSVSIVRPKWNATVIADGT